ncbi:polypyrimidine tract-binding protein homolog 3, partial [Tanacetum coccineum]
MASDDNDRDAKDALSKLLQMGTVAEYQNEPTTLGEAFSLARIAEARYEDKQATITITKPNDLTERVQVQDLEQTTQGRGDEPSRILLVTIHHMLYPITVQVLHQVFSPHGYVEKIVIFQKSAGVQPLIQFQSRQNVIVARNSLQGHNIYEGCCQLDIQFSNLEELQPNQDENICYYYWENCFSILNVDEADNTKLALSTDTFGNNGVMIQKLQIIWAFLICSTECEGTDASASYGDRSAVPEGRRITGGSLVGMDVRLSYALDSGRWKKKRLEVLRPRK